jgi:hypothetical protein
MGVVAAIAFSKRQKRERREREKKEEEESLRWLTFHTSRANWSIVIESC